VLLELRAQAPHLNPDDIVYTRIERLSTVEDLDTERVFIERQPVALQRPHLRNRLRLGALAKAELRRIRPNWCRTDSSKAVLSWAVSPFGNAFRTDTRTSEYTQVYTGESWSVYVVFTSIYFSSWLERQTMNPCDSTERAGAPGIRARGLPAGCARSRPWSVRSPITPAIVANAAAG
jgi:hypothetical protein